MSLPPSLRANPAAPITTDSLIDVQDSTDFITPAEAVRVLQASGRSVNRRQMSFWQGQGLVPPADRVGARGGVLPAIAIDLMAWIVDARERGISVNVIRELLPVWADLVAGQIVGGSTWAVSNCWCGDIGLSDEANDHVPVLVDHVLGGFCEDRVNGTNIVLKNGTIRSADEPLTLKFAIASIASDTGKGHLFAWTQLVLPGMHDRPRLDDPALIVLSLPIGVELEHDHSTSQRPRHEGRHRLTARSTKRGQKEALTLSFS